MQQTFKNIFVYAWAISRKLTSLAIFLHLVRAALPGAILYIGKVILDQIILIVKGDPASYGGTSNLAELHTLYGYLAIEFLLVVASGIISRISYYFDSILSESYGNAVSDDLMRHVCLLPLSFLERSDTQDKIDRAKKQINSGGSALTQILSQIQIGISVLIFVLGFMYYAPWLVLVVAISLAPTFIAELKVHISSHEASKDWSEEKRRKDYVRNIALTQAFQEEIKAFSLQDFLMDKFRAVSEVVAKKNSTLYFKRMAWSELYATIGTVGYYAAVVGLTLQTVAGRLTVGELALLSMSLKRLRAFLENMLVGVSQLLRQVLQLNELHAFLELKPDVSSPPGVVDFPSTLMLGMRFENVSLKYIGSEKPALDGISFSLRPGELVAIVGENGSGKSTLIKLASRLLEPDSGEIYVEERPFGQYKEESVRVHIGVLFQAFCKYNFSASENIAFSDASFAQHRASLKAITKMTLCDDFINGLPHKLDQGLGRAFPGSIELSGGQWQRVALARALWGAKSLLILDEPTSSLDEASEMAILKNLKLNLGERMALIVSHRPATLEFADRIIVLASGQIKGVGTHEELLENNAFYRDIFRSREVDFA